jgi:hypothetical protein
VRAGKRAVGGAEVVQAEFLFKAFHCFVHREPLSVYVTRELFPQCSPRSLLARLIPSV